MKVSKKILLTTLGIAAFVALFVTKVFDPTTGDRDRTIQLDAVTDVRRGLDIAGGSRLLYKIDFSKFEKIYPDPLQFAQAKKNIENIILKNIDGRISSLGVSDYRAYLQVFGDKNLLVVEIGGVTDLDEAKEIIGKTVELEFRFPNEGEPTPQERAERQTLAENLFSQSKENPNRESFAGSRGADGVSHSTFRDVQLSELPKIYSTVSAFLADAQTGELFPNLLNGTYHEIQNLTGTEKIEGFLIFRVLDRQTSTRESLTERDFSAIADQFSLDLSTDFVTNPDEISIGTPEFQLRTAVLQTQEFFPGESALDAQVFAFPKRDTGFSDLATLSGDALRSELRSRRDEADRILSGRNSTTVLTQRAALPTDIDSDLLATQDLTNFYLIDIDSRKSADARLVRQLSIGPVSSRLREEVEAALTTRNTRTIEEIFIQNKNPRIPAIDENTNKVLDGTYFRMASTSSSQLGRPVVLVNFDDTGRELFCSITEQNIGQPMAIFVGGELITSPVIQDRICGGTAQIDGQFDGESARQLAEDLNDGTLPAPLILQQEEKISPTLGARARNAALRTGAAAFAVVLIMMAVLYDIRRALVTLGSLITFFLLLLAIIKLTDFALSLSGIAAIILSIGMAVDANILIFERIREELRAGKPIRSAISTGYTRSRSAIRDGNLSTALIALVLFSLGMNIFKGFGTMMLVNTAIILLVMVPMIHHLCDRILPTKNSKK